MASRSRRSRNAILVAILLFSAAGGAGFLHGCAGASSRRGESTPDGYPPPDRLPDRAPGVPAPFPLVRPEPPGGRPVRVLLGEGRKELSIEGEVIRVWNVAGKLVAEGSGRIRLSAQGGKILFEGGRSFDSPVDIAAAAYIRLSGKRLPGRVRISAQKGQLTSVAVVPQEEYVGAVLSREAPPAFHPEALAALSVAVRTYARLAVEKPRRPDHDLVDGVEDQVFGGTDNVADLFRRAVEATRGEVLSYKGSLARAVYHSTCGGRTETAKDAWGTDVPYLRSVACDDCRDSPARHWDYRIPAGEGKRVALQFGVRAGDDLRLSVAGRSASGRASRIRFSSMGVSRDAPAAAFRRAAGYARVKSLRMDITPVGNGWMIVGQGYGHGVGMCQWGANGMAKSGKTHGEILARYYPGTSLVRGAP